MPLRILRILLLLLLLRVHPSPSELLSREREEVESRPRLDISERPRGGTRVPDRRLDPLSPRRFRADDKETRHSLVIQFTCGRIDRVIRGEPVSSADKNRGNMKIWNAKRVSSSLTRSLLKRETKDEKIRSDSAGSARFDLGGDSRAFWVSIEG